MHRPREEAKTESSGVLGGRNTCIDPGERQKKSIQGSQTKEKLHRPREATKTEYLGVPDERKRA